MKKMQCEVCGSSDFIKRNELFVCQSCGCKYLPEYINKLLKDVPEHFCSDSTISNGECLSSVIDDVKNVSTSEEYESGIDYSDSNDATAIDFIDNYTEAAVEDNIDSVNDVDDVEGEDNTENKNNKQLKIISISVLCLIVGVILIACIIDGTKTNISSINSIPKLCELIGKSKRNIPYSSSDFRNVDLQDYNDTLIYTINTTNSKYCIAGLSSPPQKFEVRIENGKIHRIALTLTEHDFDIVASWAKFRLEELNSRFDIDNPQAMQELDAYYYSGGDGFIGVKEFGNMIDFTYRHNNIKYSIMLDYSSYVVIISLFGD